MNRNTIPDNCSGTLYEVERFLHNQKSNSKTLPDPLMCSAIDILDQNSVLVKTSFPQIQ